MNQKQNKLELMLQQKQNMTFSTQLVISLTYSNLESIFTINNLTKYYIVLTDEFFNADGEFQMRSNQMLNI